ncbi:MAG: C4-type zinc ribbon domain-containing protein [Chloroflexi bacterium]|nr:C4-type zinc ribbon domain-containing protein [Chloroflexota bacterium]
MSERARAVWNLWRIDSEIQQVESRIFQLTSQLGDQVKVKAGDIAIRRAKDSAAQALSRQRDQEFELAQLEARIKELDTRLWSGKGSPRDLEMLRVELDREKSRRNGIEEQTIGAMETTERSQRDLARVEAAVATALASLQSGNVQRVAERIAATSRRDALTADRLSLIEGMPPEDAGAYSRQRVKSPDGVPVAELSGSQCQGCRTDIPSGDAQRARRAAAPFPCPSCGRLLFIPNA